jgi:hypothetical protein
MTRSTLAFAPLFIALSLVATLFSPAFATIAAGAGVDQAMVDALNCESS